MNALIQDGLKGSACAGNINLVIFAGAHYGLLCLFDKMIHKGYKQQSLNYTYIVYIIKPAMLMTFVAKGCIRCVK